MLEVNADCQIDNTQHGPEARVTMARSLGWADFAAAVCFTVAACMVTRDAWADIFRIGKIDEECSYVLLAPVVIAVLAFGRRAGLRSVGFARGWAGLLVLLAGWGVHWFGYLHDPVLWRAGAVLIAVGTLMTVIGFNASRKILPALVACLFLIPVDPTGRMNIAQPLQVATADVTQRLCALLTISVDRTGEMLSVNGTDVTVAEACNGTRMVVTLFMVCYLVAFTRRLGFYPRLLVLAASPLVAIVSNVLRLVPTVWVFGHYPLKTAERFHDVSGWVMTALALLVLLGFLRLMEPARRAAL